MEVSVTLPFVMKTRASYPPGEKVQIIRSIFSRKTTIQKVSKEKGIAPTLISLWKKQAEEAILARFQPQPKGRKKAAPAPVAPTSEEVRSLKNEVRKAKIKAAHLESSAKEAKARFSTMEASFADLAATMGFRLVKARRPRKPRASKA